MPVATDAAASAATDAAGKRNRYPPLNLEAFGDQVVQVHPEPPMWLIKKVLPPEDCDALIREGREERLPEVRYEGSVVAFDETRLRTVGLLMPAVAAGGAGAIHAGEGPIAAFTAAALAASVFAISIAGLREVVRWATTKAASAGGRGGARFLGKKWRLPAPDATRDGVPIASGAYQRLMRQIAVLCKSQSFLSLEPPTLTRYKKGEGQSLHIDSHARPGPDAADAEKAGFAARGGQRMIQCLCYLNDVDIDLHAGATKFQHESIGQLRVQPQAGSVLVFCTSFADGGEDSRMVHLAEELQGPVEKWVIPVWSCEREHLGWQKQWPSGFKLDQVTQG